LKKLVLLVVLIIAIILIMGCEEKYNPFVSCSEINSTYCGSDSDCVCNGFDSETGMCYLGNMKYFERCVDRQDFVCEGYCPYPMQCIDNKCESLPKI
jgi:hypothetical protein